MTAEIFMSGRPMYAGKVYADVGFPNAPIIMASIRPNVLHSSAALMHPEGCS